MNNEDFKKEMEGISWGEDAGGGKRRGKGIILRSRRTTIWIIVQRSDSGLSTPTNGEKTRAKKKRGTDRQPREWHLRRVRRYTLGGLFERIVKKPRYEGKGGIRVAL